MILKNMNLLFFYNKFKEIKIFYKIKMLKKNEIIAIITIIGIIAIIILIIVMLNKSKSKENFKDSNDDNNNILSEECNNNGYFNPISKECECKSQQMLRKINNIPYNFTENILQWKKDQLNTNYKNEDIKLYSGDKCELPVQLTSLNFTLNPCEPNKTCTFTTDPANDNAYKNDAGHVLYSKNLPLDVETYSNILLLKICPFHEGLKIKNIKINNGSILGLDNVYPLGENTGYQDVNDCKIIYQGYSGFPVKTLMTLAGLPVIADSWTHLGGIDCDFTLVGKYNTSEEWSIDLNVKRQGFDILNMIVNPGVTYNLDLKVTYKDTGAIYDNYYIKNGTFDYMGAIPYGLGYMPVPGISYDPPSPSMIVIGEPKGVYLNPFKKAAKDAGYEISDDSQIFLYLINNYTVKCNGNIYPWVKESGFWESIFIDDLHQIGSYMTFIIPWLSDKDNANPCVISSDDKLFNIRNIILEQNPFNSIYIYSNGSWITNTRGTDLSFIPSSFLDWITKIKGILIFNDSPSVSYRTPIPYSLSFDIGTPETKLLKDANDIPAGAAHSIATGQGFGTCKYVYVIPWNGVKFLNYTINHGTNSTTWQWGGVWFEAPFSKYWIPGTTTQADMDPEYVFESVNFTGLDVIITVSQDTDDGSPYIYQIVIKKGDCGYLAGPSTIEVIGTDNVQIEQPTIGILGTDAYPGVVIVGKKVNQESTIKLNCDLNSFPPTVPTLNFIKKDDRYEYFVKQPTISPDYTTTGNYPGFVFITPKVNIKMLCTTDEGCNTNGTCHNYSCVCKDGYYGDKCEYKKCPNNCSGKGVCKDGVCICDKTGVYSGDDCSKVDCTKFVDIIKQCKQTSCKDLNQIIQECNANNCGPTICSACADQNDCGQNQFCLFNSDGTSACKCKNNWILNTKRFTSTLNCNFGIYDPKNNLYSLYINMYPVGDPGRADNPSVIFSLNQNNLVVNDCINSRREPCGFVDLVGGLGAVLKLNNGQYSNDTCTLSLDSTKPC
jgi:hypothetical protein